MTRAAVLWLLPRIVTGALVAYAIYRVVVYATEPLWKP